LIVAKEWLRDRARSSRKESSDLTAVVLSSQYSLFIRLYCFHVKPGDPAPRVSVVSVPIRLALPVPGVGFEDSIAQKAALRFTGQGRRVG
jgi:hypothetical protein